MDEDETSVEPQDAPVEEPVAEAGTDEPEAELPATEEPTPETEPAAAAAEVPQEPVAEEDVPDVSVAAPPEAAPAPPQEALSGKERRRHARQRSATGVGTSRSPQERKAERDALRAKAGKARAQRRHKERERKPAASAPVAAEPHERGRQKTRQGIVTSDKAAKTITVRIDTSRRHRRYEKIVRNSKSLHAHDENNEAHEGDLVRVIETRPLSRTKRWRLDAILERAR